MSSLSCGVIGGLFGLATASLTKDAEDTPFAGSSMGYFLNARCAIYAVSQSVKPETAWLPSYLCGAVLDPFRALKIRVRHYDAGPNFASGGEEWTIKVKPGDLVLAIHYFGFPNTRFPASDLKRRGATIVEDASQGLFLKQQFAESLCIIYSPRKFLGVPDGGVMSASRSDAIPTQPLEPPPTQWWRNALAMTEMRREFDLVGGENNWFSLFRRVEETFPLGLYRSSDLARVLVEGGTDYEFVRTARRQNYLLLSDRLKDFALFPVLGPETVPLGFPVCIGAEHRDAVLESLYAQGIYAPVHWHIADIVPKKYERSHRLSQRILTLICDQRYTTADMERQTEAFLSAAEVGSCL